MARARKTISVDDLWKFERASARSPLARRRLRRSARCSSFSMEENKGQTSLWLLSTFGGGPRRLTSCGEKDGQPAWSPNRRRIAFLARREQHGAKDETQQLYVIAPDGGEARRVNDFAPGVRSFAGCPDGKAHRLRRLGVAELRGSRRRRRLQGIQRSARRAPTSPAGAVPLLGSLAADGPRAAPAPARPRQRPHRRPVRGRGLGSSRAPEPDATASTSRPTDAASSSPTTPAPRSAWTTAARWPRSSCARAASPRSRTTRPGT